MQTIKLTILVLTILPTSQCAKILGVFHWPAPSHHIIGWRLMKELALRGHEVTFINPFPQKTPIKNLREIPLTGFKEQFDELKNSMNLFEAMNSPLTRLLFAIRGLGSEMVDKTFSHENVRKLLDSNETFDLIIKEQFQDDALLGLAYHYKAPVLILSTLGSSSWTNQLVGNPAPPSYVVNFFSNYPPNMTFLERTLNTISRLFSDLLTLYMTSVQNRILHKHVPDAPHVQELMHNVSFVLLNSHTSFDSPVPSVPNMAQIGSFHVEPPKKLPEDLQEFLDGAKEGVVYFSFGSNLRSRDLPIEKRNEVLKVFSKIKEKVLWKWEEEELPGKPENVKIQKWLPQQDVLAHPNVKVFITHGGLLSTIEAVYHGVSIIGIPVFGDQMMNMANAARKGYGILVPFKELSEVTLGGALKEILRNTSYSENAKRRSELLRDQPVKPIDSAVYWVEYVVRNKGAPHLKSAALDLAWYQYFLLDVFLFLSLILAGVISLIYIVLKRLCFGRKKSKQKIY